MAKSVSEKCITCNAPLKYNSKTDLFECEYCGNKFKLTELEENKRKVSEIKKKSKKSKPKTLNIDAYHCENCGASIILGENTASSSCVYCKSSAIIPERLEGIYAPSKIITFKYNKEEAIDKFRELCKGRKLMPNDFDNLQNIQDMEGLYVPFWLYNCENEAHLEADCRNTSTWSDSRYVNTKTDFYKVDVDGILCFNNVPNDAASRFDDKIMHAIEPYDYKEFKDFNKSYLAGYISEKYDVLQDEAYKVACKRIDEDGKKYLFNKINGYSTKFIKNYQSSLSLLNNDYVLLPVWVLNIKYKDKIYHFALNGQTGKMVGEIPVDKKKLCKLIFLCFSIISFILCILVFVVAGGIL